jgi:hypothetical protein
MGGHDCLPIQEEEKAKAFLGIFMFQSTSRGGKRKKMMLYSRRKFIEKQL